MADHALPEAYAGPRPAWRDRGAVSSTELLIALAALAAIREPLGVPVFLKFFIFVVGFAHLMNLRLHRLALFAAPLAATATFVSVLNDTPPISVVRLQFVTACVLFCSFLALQDRERLVRGLKLYLLPAILALTLLEIAVGTDKSREMQSFLSIIGVNLPLDIRLPRLRGVVGDPNFSAMVMAMLTLTFLAHRERAAAALASAVMLMMISRGAILALVVAGIVYLLPARALKVGFAALLLAIFLLMPVTIVAIDAIATPEEKIQLILGTSRRYLHWLNYANFGWNNPLGVGYFQGIDYYSEAVGHFQIGDYRARGDGIYQEAHNFVLDVWAELGPPTVVMLGAFLVWVLAQAARKGRFELAMFSLLMTGYLLLSGISDWTFWFGVGLILSRPAAERRAAGR